MIRFLMLASDWIAEQQRQKSQLERLFKDGRVDIVIPFMLRSPDEFVTEFEKNLEYILPHINSRFWNIWKNYYSFIDLNCLESLKQFIYTGNFTYTFPKVGEYSQERKFGTYYQKYQGCKEICFFSTLLKELLNEHPVQTPESNVILFPKRAI